MQEFAYENATPSGCWDSMKMSAEKQPGAINYLRSLGFGIIYSLTATPGHHGKVVKLQAWRSITGSKFKIPEVFRPSSPLACL